MHQLSMAGSTRIVILVLFAICVGKLSAGVVEAAQWQPVAENRAFSNWQEGQKWDNRRSDAAPVAVAPAAQQQAPETVESGDRTAKFINFRNIISSNSVSNEIDTDGDQQKSADAATPSAALTGIYTECLSQLSLTCVQKKVLVFLDRLGRSESFGLIGNFMTVVRTKQSVEAPLDEAELKDDDDMDVAAARFFDNHVVRVTLPSWSDSAAVEGKAGTSLDISLPTTAVEEGRKKKKGGKMIKKLMMMLGMAAAAKMALMIPLGLLLIKIKAVKALLIGKLALMISKFLLIKKLLAAKKGGGGGGKEKHIILVHADSHGGGHGGGGGGHGGGHGGGSDSYGPPSGGGGGGGGYSSGGHGGGGDSGWSSGGGGGGGGGGHSSGGGGGWSGGGGGGSSGWGRAIRSVEDPHLIAYRGQYNN